MAKTLTDLSQLTRSMVKQGKMEPVKPPPQKKTSADDALAYFTRPAGDPATGRESTHTASKEAERIRELEMVLEEKEAALVLIAEEKAATDETASELLHRLDSEREAHNKTRKELSRIQGECARLEGELRKAAKNAPVSASSADAPTARDEGSKPTRGLLEGCSAVMEVFEGELREQVLASLTDARDAACRSGRERRAYILDRVLSENHLSGELDRRRAEVKQILKDAGSFADASTLSALERIGIKCISGKKHWKLEYGNVRVPIAKTPSDHRASLNTATDLANRCF